METQTIITLISVLVVIFLAWYGAMIIMVSYELRVKRVLIAIEVEHEQYVSVKTQLDLLLERLEQMYPPKHEDPIANAFNRRKEDK